MILLYNNECIRKLRITQLGGVFVVGWDFEFIHSLFQEREKIHYWNVTHMHSYSHSSQMDRLVLHKSH
jgi:hypothetical protein